MNNRARMEAAGYWTGDFDADVRALLEALERVTRERGAESGKAEQDDLETAHGLTRAAMERWNESQDACNALRARVAALEAASEELTVVNLRAEVERLKARAADAEYHMHSHIRATDTAQAERDALKAALRDVLASAYPDPIEHPMMTAAWKRARMALGEGP